MTNTIKNVNIIAQTLDSNKRRENKVDNIEIGDSEFNQAEKLILNSESEIKKKFIQYENLEQMRQQIQKLPEDRIRKMIQQKIAKIRNKKLKKDELDRLECEIALLVSSLPVDIDKAKNYWKEVEENARKNNKT